MLSCASCPSRNHNTQICSIFQCKVPDDFFCKYAETSYHTCEICGNLVPNDRLYLTLVDDDKYLYAHHQCIKAYGHCETCANASLCAFQTSAIEIPPVVVQTIHQGNAVIQQQVKNPARIAETCAKGCSCYIDEKCRKESGNTCDNYNFIKKGE